MPRLSKLLEKLEDRTEGKINRWMGKNKGKLYFYIPFGLVVWYFYGMLINSLRLGIGSTFGEPEAVSSIWVLNPFKNWFVVFTPFGLATTAFLFLMGCLSSKKGYKWFSGYRYTRDPRGFDILPDGTHGTSGFLTEKEMREFLEVGNIEKIKGVLLGKIKEKPDDPDKYALYVAHPVKEVANNNFLCIGAPGSRKTRGFIMPFLMGVAKREESVIVTDPKGELFEQFSTYFEERGYYVKAVNFLNMEHSDGWNCLDGLNVERDLVQTVANTIIQNTSGPKEADDFWSKAELNLLIALLHYICNRTDDNGNLLPIEQRSIGAVYRILAYDSIPALHRRFRKLDDDHPAKIPYNLFLKAKEQLWANIITGLANRLAVYQSQLVDKITSYHDVDLTLPGQKKCAYFVIISAQDNAYRFLSSLFFSLAIPELSALAFDKGGRLPVLVNLCLDEFCNIGYMESVAKSFNSIRGFNMSCQVVVQSLAQWKDTYPGFSWETHLGAFDQTLYMGCNDVTTARYLSEKCGKVTIQVINNQMPMTPLFSPIYSSVRPYSQTKSNTARDLMLTDEILRLDNRKCLALFNHGNPAMLYKLNPEDLPEYGSLKSRKVSDYTPDWVTRDQEHPLVREKPPKEPEEDAEEAPASSTQRQPKRWPAEDKAPAKAPTPAAQGKPVYSTLQSNFNGKLEEETMDTECTGGDVLGIE